MDEAAPAATADSCLPAAPQPLPADVEHVLSLLEAIPQAVEEQLVAGVDELLAEGGEGEEAAGEEEELEAAEAAAASAAL